MENLSKKQQKINLWRENNQPFYDFIFENFLDWPCTSVQWGQLLQSNEEFVQQRVYFSCRTDGIYSNQQKTWQNTPNYIVMATVQIPNESHYFINDLRGIFNYDAPKKHPNLKVRQIITHPGQVTVIRSSPSNRKLLASKSETNIIYLWTSQKYKANSMNNYATTPDITLMATKSQRPNYALRFSPSLPRIISASGNKLQVFDLDAGPTKRQLGSVLSANIMKPITTLQGHDKVQDITFKTNQICLSGGQDRQIGIWDLRIGCLIQKIKDIHQNDINSISVKDHYIISGGEQGRVNIIDQRTYKKRPIYSIQFNPLTHHFAVGKDTVAIYSIDNIQQSKQFQPIFVHHGMRGHINQFDWNNQCPYTMLATCQENQLQLPAHGGLIHLFRPIQLFFQSREQAINNLQEAYYKLDPIKQKLYD